MYNNHLWHTATDVGGFGHLAAKRPDAMAQVNMKLDITYNYVLNQTWTANHTAFITKQQ